MLNNVVVKRLLLVVGVVATLLLIAAGVYKLRKIGIDQQQIAWKDDGIKASEAGDDAQAVDLLSRYFRARCDDPKAVTSYVRSRLRQGHGDAQSMVDSIGAIQLLTQLRPLTSDENHQLLDLYLKTSDQRHAVHTADVILAADPNDATALSAKTQALLHEGEFAKALAVAKDWAAAQPSDVRAHCTAMLAMQCLKQNGTDALTYASDLLKSHPDDAKFQFLKSFALTLTNQAQSQDDAPAGTPQTAAELARAAAAHPIADPIFASLLVSQLDQLGLFDDSFSVLEKTNAQVSDSGIRLALARRYMELNRWEQLAEVTTVAVGDTDDSERLVLRGLAFAHLGRSVEVAPIRATLASRSADAIAAAWISILDDASGHSTDTPLQKIDRYEAALAQNPQNALFSYAQAEAYVQLGEPDLAVSRLIAVTQLNRTWDLPVARLATILLDQDHIAAAFEAGVEYQRRASHNGQIRDVSGVILLARLSYAGIEAGLIRDNGSAGQFADAVQQKFPGEPQTLMIRVGLLARAGKKDEAAKVLKEAASSRQVPATTLLQYAALSQRLSVGLEDQFLQTAAQQQNPAAAYAYAASLFAKKKPAEALAQFAPADNATDAGQREAFELARAKYFELINDPQAASQWSALASRYPNSLPVQRAVIESRSAQADRALADQTIERLHKLTGDGGVTWRVFRANWIAQTPKRTQADSEQASQLLNAVLRNSPNCVDAHLLLASNLQSLGNLDGALQHLQMAQRLVAGKLSIALPLAQLQEQRGQDAQALQTLRPFTSGQFANITAIFSSGIIQEHAGDTTNAESSYRQALKMQPDFVGAQNNLAALLVKRGRPEDQAEALDLAKRAAAASPNTPTIFDTLAAAQASNGDIEQALISISKAIELDPTSLLFKLRRVEMLAASPQHLGDAKAAFADLNQDLAKADTSTQNNWDIRTRLNALRHALTQTAQNASSKPSGSADTHDEIVK